MRLQPEGLESGPSGYGGTTQAGAMGKGSKGAQKYTAGIRVLLRAFPVKFIYQVFVGASRRDADIVQEPRFKEKAALVLAHIQHSTTLQGHDAHPLAVGYIIHAHQIKRIGEGLYHLPEIYRIICHRAAAPALKNRMFFTYQRSLKGGHPWLCALPLHIYSAQRPACVGLSMELGYSTSTLPQLKRKGR